MSTDRTSEWWDAVARSLQAQGAPQDEVRKLKERAVLKPVSRPHSEFTRFTHSVVESITGLREFIRLHQKDYLATAGTAYSEGDKDRIESEVGQYVKACTQQIETLKRSVMAAQGRQQAKAKAKGGSGGEAQQQPGVNEQTAAHLHGVVLSLAERLHAVSSRFDRFRAARYQQIMERQAAKAAAAAALAARPAAAPASRPSASSAPAAPSAASSFSATFSGPPSAIASSLLGQVVGAGGAAWSRVAGGSTASTGTASGRSLGGAAASLFAAAAGTAASGGGHRQQPAAAGAGAGSSIGAGGSGTPQQQQQQQLLDDENRRLVEQLTGTAQQVAHVERTMREIATLNQLFSTAVLHQAEAIESIYNAAVEASHNVKAGNESLRKTIAVNRSTQRYIFVLLLVATLGLIFMDWFHS